MSDDKNNDNLKDLDLDELNQIAGGIKRKFQNEADVKLTDEVGEKTVTLKF